MRENRSGGQLCSVKYFSCEDVNNGGDLLGEDDVANDPHDEDKQQDGSDSQGENCDEMCESMEPKRCKDLLQEDGRDD